MLMVLPKCMCIHFDALTLRSIALVQEQILSRSDYIVSCVLLSPLTIGVVNRGDVNIKDVQNRKGVHMLLREIVNSKKLAGATYRSLEASTVYIFRLENI